MELRLRLLDSWWLRSADYEMFGDTDYNYGFALPEDVKFILRYVPKDEPDNVVELSCTLSQLLKGHNGHKVNSEKIIIPTDEHEYDYYEERDYVTEEEIEDINEDLTVFYFTSNLKKYYLYDVVKYKGKILHLYLDE